jgi:hypothetical protein
MLSMSDGGLNQGKDEVNWTLGWWWETAAGVQAI